jgi:hypothetical protein
MGAMHHSSDVIERDDLLKSIGMPCQYQGLLDEFDGDSERGKTGDA